MFSFNSNNSNANSRKSETILQPLNMIQRRQRIQKIIEGTVLGFLLSSITVVLLEFVLLFLIILGFLNFFNLLFFLLFFLILFFGTIIGVAAGIFFPVDGYESARLSDGYYHFKDRLLTARKLLLCSEPTLMERLQLDDAANYARKIDPKLVIPYRLPSYFFGTIFLFGISMVLGLILPYFFQQADAVILTRLPEIIAVTETLQKELVKEVTELAEKNPEEVKLKRLSGELQKLVKQLDQSATDTKASLSTLSEMEEAIRLVLSEFRAETFDISMQEVAEALSVAEATHEISRSLRAEQYIQAAEELKKFDTRSMETMSKQERNAVGDQMRTTLKNMDHRNQKTLQETTEKLAEGFEQNDGDKLREGADELAAECNKQALRKEISNSLEGKLTLLGLCKSESNGSGGVTNNSNSGGGNTNKSDLADKNWGTGAAGNPASGEAAQLESQREQQNITGILGQDGESEYEKFHSNEATQEKIVREQRESSIQEYHKIAEAVLEAEPIPLGQRQMIRRYFELIRSE
ncbi:MAG: hypothetical protein LBE12_15005 [Planctomycetaceae bacterium]|jgi:hypothetical protein|nr:hypothetical protein [Planctomycetaceae bacterium]